MASIRPHQGKWRVFVRRSGVSRSKVFGSWAEADQWARRAEGRIAAPDFVNTTEAERTTLRECLERYAVEVSPTKKGHRQELRKINRLLQEPLADRTLAEIRSAEIAQWRTEQVEKGYAPSTIRNGVTLISQVFETARVEWGMTGIGNPCRGVRMPRARPGRDRRLVGGEEGQILAACDRVGCPWIKAAFVLALETAMRMGEMLGARRVDLKGRVLHLPDTKNGRVRHVPLSSRALAALQELPTRLDGKLIGLTAPQLDSKWRRVCRIAGVKGLRWHDLRHEGTSRLFEKGLPMHEVMKITGHRTTMMLLRYTHVEAEALAAKLG